MKYEVIKPPFLTYPSGAVSLLIREGKEWNVDDISHRIDWAYAHAKFNNLKSGAAAVLNYLAFCWTSANGCFPSIDKIAEETCMTNSSVNTHLALLKNKGLIWSLRRSKPGGQSNSNMYHLSFEEIFPNTESKTKNFGGGTIPKPKILKTKTKNTVLPKTKKMGTNKQDINKQDNNYTHDDLQNDFIEFFELYPRPGDKEITLLEYNKAITAGVSHCQIINAVKKYISDNQPNINSGMFQYLKFSHLWLKQKYYERYPLTQLISNNLICDISPLTVKAIREGKQYLCTGVSSQTTAKLIAGKHVTLDQCRLVGLNV